jgi:hypothetical protein
MSVVSAHTHTHTCVSEIIKLNYGVLRRNLNNIQSGIITINKHHPQSVWLEKFLKLN